MVRARRARESCPSHNGHQLVVTVTSGVNDADSDPTNGPEAAVRVVAQAASTGTGELSLRIKLEIETRISMKRSFRPSNRQIENRPNRRGSQATKLSCQRRN